MVQLTFNDANTAKSGGDMLEQTIKQLKLPDIPWKADYTHLLDITGVHVTEVTAGPVKDFFKVSAIVTCPRADSPVIIIMIKRLLEKLGKTSGFTYQVYQFNNRPKKYQLTEGVITEDDKPNSNRQVTYNAPNRRKRQSKRSNRQRRGKGGSNR